MTTKTDELKPCPFCGGEASFERQGTHRQSCIVVCNSCGCRHESGYEYELSAYGWNTRAALQSQDRKDAERYRVLRLHTAPLRLAESMGIPRKQVKRSDDPAARVDEMCDAAIDHARRIEGEAK